LIAVIGFAAGEARAASIMMTIVTNGHTIVVGGGQIQSSSATSLTINTAALNTTLHSAAIGSAYTFSTLGASSDFPGATGTKGGFLGVTGTVDLPPGQAGAAGSLTITVTETGFTAPPAAPTGLMQEASTAQYTNTSAGDNQSATGTYNAQTLSLASATMTSTGPALNNYSPMTSAPIVPFVSPYDLKQAVTLTLSKNGLDSTDQFAGTVKVTTQAVPEPASAVLMLTSLPLPLVVVGLLRRRRAVARV
jgi:hypothetical protein